MREIIDKEMRIYSCGLSDLTAEQAARFLNSWNDGSSLATLTFFSEKDGAIVLNHDNKNFELYRDLVKAFAAADSVGDADIMLQLEQKAPEGVKDQIFALKNMLIFRKGRDQRRQALYTDVDEAAQKVLEVMCREECHDFTMHLAYCYGVAQGKRFERARRRRGERRSYT